MINHLNFLQVDWSSSGDIVISLPHSLQKKTCGLCGNFDDLRHVLSYFYLI